MQAGGELRNKNVRLNSGSSELTRTAGARSNVRPTSRLLGQMRRQGELRSSGYKRKKLIKVGGLGVHKSLTKTNYLM